MNKIFCCYSVALRDHLLNNGFKYEVVGLNPNSLKMFWGFIKTEKLDAFLNDWSSK